MAESLGATAITSGVVAVFRILELTYELKAVGEQTTALLNLVQHVDRNIREARRLLAVREPLLSEEEKTWMRGSIRDTEAAVRSVAQLIEPARVAVQAQKSISFKTYVDESPSLLEGRGRDKPDRRDTRRIDPLLLDFVDWAAFPSVVLL